MNPPRSRAVREVDVQGPKSRFLVSRRVPQSQRLHYKSGGDWKPVPDAGEDAVKKDHWNVVRFPAVATAGPRIEFQRQPESSGGNLEWCVWE